MGLINSLQAIGTLTALILLCFLWKIKAYNGHKTQRKQAPTPPGALPIIGHLHLLVGKKPPQQVLAAMPDKCGPASILQFGVHRTLVVSSWELAKERFTTKDRVFATGPQSAATKYLGYNNMSGSSPYGTYLREMRKLATIELFSKSRLEKLKHVRVSTINMSIKEVYTRWALDGGSQPVKLEMKQWTEHLNLNLITQMIAGKRCYGNIIDGYKDEAQRYRKATAQFMYLFGVFVVSDALPYLECLDLGGHFKAMKNVATEFDYLVGSWLEEHRQKIANKVSATTEDSEQLDFIDVLADNSPRRQFQLRPRPGYNPQGNSTVSFLMNNRHMLQRVQDEFNTNVGRHRNVEDYDIKNLLYLNAIIKETMRLRPPSPLGLPPPSPLGLPHESVEDCQVGDYHVPKGTRLVAIYLWKLHRDPRVWQDPNEFKPERFLTTHPNMDTKGQNFELIPFGSGMRICPGFNLATQVLHLTLARLLHAFNLDTNPSNSPVDMVEGLGVTMPIEQLL